MTEIKHADADNGWCSQCKWWPFDHYCPVEHPLWAIVQAMHKKMPADMNDSTMAYNIGGAWLSAANLLQGALFKELNPDVPDGELPAALVSALLGRPSHD